MTTKPKPYVPSFLKAALSGSRPVQLTFSDVADTNIASTSSFIYDPLGTPLKSTQQLNVDFSKFENHCFFMNAEAKVNVAFDQIINGYPFDGTRGEHEEFFEKLTGFDKWIFDEFPKFKGQLHFSGTLVGEDTSGELGTWIAVKDHAGSLFPELARNASGDSVLNPKNGESLTLEVQIKIPAQINDTQMICQKMSSETEGFCLYIEPSLSTTEANVKFIVVSGSNSISTTATLIKDQFQHLTVVLNRDSSVHFLQCFNAGELIEVSRSSVVIGDMSIDSSDLLIGTGSSIHFNGSTITPTQTFSGSIDEFRIFHSARTQTQIKQYSKKPIFATDDLKLYYRFNEPPPPLALSDDDTINSIVIDSSGNALHALISNFTGTLRQDATLDETSRMLYELSETTPILFPAYPDVIELNDTLLTSASLYDNENPNLITRLIPQHYLLEGALQDGFSEIEGSMSEPYAGSGIAGQGRIGNTQLMLSFLYIYARFFDELKLYVDSFSTLRHVDYNTNETIPDNFILNLIEQTGFHLPPLFNDSTLEQYIRAENIDTENSVSTYPLKHVQNQLLRRALVNMPDVLKSKGTQHSIKSFLRSVGIDPDNSLRIREFGGPTERVLTFSREEKREPGAMVDFITSSYVISPFLSASRVEPGQPKIAGAFIEHEMYPVNGISDDSNDGLLTSGSWTVEMIVKWTPVHQRMMTSPTQSLTRLVVTGSQPNSLGIVGNFYAISSSVEPRLELHLRPGVDNDSPLGKISLALPSDDLFAGEKWNLSFGCERNDAIGSNVSSSYFIRASKSEEGKIESYHSTSSFFYENPSGEINAFRALHPSSSSGISLVIGEGHSAPSNVLFLNNTDANANNFTGKLSNLRFWSKALTENEWKEHVRNFKSVGVANPLTNYNYVTTASGSFERLRIETFSKQSVTTANNNGDITFVDFTQNNFHLSGYGFPVDSPSLTGELFSYSYLSPAFDEATCNNKVRVRGYKDQRMIDETPWAQAAPIYEITKSEQPTDDVRFSIEFSLIDALNRDIVRVMNSLDFMSTAIGSPELLFSPDYPDLERMADAYYNRLSEKLNFKAFHEFFKFFDTQVGTFIEQLIPKKTDFKGINFMIESPMLERHKMTYQGNEQYLSEGVRARMRDVLLLAQIVGSFRKY